MILSNFAGTWFVAQFLPIAPQLVILAPLDAPSCVARLKTCIRNPFEPFAPSGEPAKVCGLCRRYHLYGLWRQSALALLRGESVSNKGGRHVFFQIPNEASPSTQ